MGLTYNGIVIFVGVLLVPCQSLPLIQRAQGFILSLDHNLDSQRSPSNSKSKTVAGFRHERRSATRRRRVSLTIAPEVPCTAFSPLSQ